MPDNAAHSRSSESLVSALAISAYLLISGPNQAGKVSGKRPTPLPVYMYRATSASPSTILRAGVAQLVERVALITAKRSTSRSWVRAPPSAIPISKLIRAAVLLLFGLDRGHMACGLYAGDCMWLGGLFARQERLRGLLVVSATSSAASSGCTAVTVFVWLTVSRGMAVATKATQVDVELQPRWTVDEVGRMWHSVSISLCFTQKARKDL